MRIWNTDGRAAADTRVGRIERWLVTHGWLAVANWIARVKGWR